MSKNLVIVESPAKCKTIEKYLGSDYKVVSSKGHIRDLAKTGSYGFGIDVEDNFKPNYVIMKEKKKDVTALLKSIDSYDKIYLATDPDREGEAISFHLKEALEIPESKYERIVFNEITKKAILDSFNYIRKIDYDLVNSQETRRMLDRIIGFRLSKLMQSKIGSKSAGRVQSVALLLIVDKEKEINAFVIEEYWSIHAEFPEFSADLTKYNNKKIEIPNEETATNIINALSNSFTIDNVDKKDTKKASKPPFTTSTLQQLASSKLGFKASKTMSVAQKLYEGMNIGSETTGLITYMRTDSLRLSSDFINETNDYIKNNFGNEYVGSVKVAKKNDNVQDAHEAIRPTSINRTPEDMKPYLSNDEYRLYKLIYTRALASLMANAIMSKTTVTLINNDYEFKANGSILKFDGYLKVYSDYETNTDVILPNLEDYHTPVILTTKIEKKQHFTEPPARYSESTLIKTLEELGIGRPSTYSSIISTIQARDYVTLIDKKFHPTDSGIETIEALLQNFDNIINVKYTANMESNLDDISQGKLVWHEMMREFYDSFMENVQTAFDTMEKKEAEKTGDTCPNCGSDMVFKKSRYGQFEACSNYPTCKYIKQEEKKEESNICKCPKCEEGHIVSKKTRKNKIFFGCNNYPKCNYALWDMPSGNICDTCGGLKVIKGNKEMCPECDKKEKPTKK